MRNNDIHGIFLVDKPPGPTSHDVVEQIRRRIRGAKVGHAGTLDPAATGLLVICVGQATRVAEYLQEYDKTYEATIELGRETDTLDAQGVVVQEKPVGEFSEIALREVLRKFMGTSDQRAPRFSAVHVRGRRMHEWARQGVEVEGPVRRVEIHALDLLKVELPHLAIRVRCSSGTYVRALAADIGRALGPGAHLGSLRRHAVGPYRVEDALPLETFQADRWRERLIPLRDMLPEVPRWKLPPALCREALTGRRLEIPAHPYPQGQKLFVLDCEAEALGIAEAGGGKLLTWLRVFSTMPRGAPPFWHQGG